MAGIDEIDDDIPVATEWNVQFAYEWDAGGKPAIREALQRPDGLPYCLLSAVRRARALRLKKVGQSLEIPPGLGASLTFPFKSCQSADPR